MGKLYSKRNMFLEEEAVEEMEEANDKWLSVDLSYNH